MQGMSGRHKRNLWLAGQCGRRDDGRGVRFLWYGAGFWCFLDDGVGSLAFHGWHSCLVEGASEEFFSLAIKFSIDWGTFIV